MYGREKKIYKPKTQKQSEENITKSMINLFILKKEKKDRLIKDRIIGDIRTIFEQDDYYKLRRVGNSWNNNYIEYESNGH